MEDAEPGWRKSYIVRPAGRPEGATHVLVGTPDGGAVEPLWGDSVAADSGAGGGP